LSTSFRAAKLLRSNSLIFTSSGERNNNLDMLYGLTR
jgi:hypothetical protein